MSKMGNIARLATQGDTRWYSHYGLILSIFKDQSSLEEYKSLIVNSEPFMRNTTACSALDSIGNSTFWTKYGSMSDLLRPINIEIGLIENCGDNLSKCGQSCGRI